MERRQENAGDSETWALSQRSMADYIRSFLIGVERHGDGDGAVQMPKQAPIPSVIVGSRRSSSASIVLGDRLAAEVA